VVSTAVMGTKEVLADGNGCLIAADNGADFASKAIDLLSDRSLRATLGEQARAHARTWSAPELADRMLDLYRRVKTQAQERPAGPGPRPGIARSAWRNLARAWPRDGK